MNSTIYTILISVSLLTSCKNCDNSRKTKTVYDKDGNLVSETQFLNDFQHGVTKDYYKSGIVKEETNYFLGLKDGPNKAYYENGKIKRIGVYLDDFPDGEYIWYAPNGNLKGRNNWIKGIQYGESLFYFDDGKLELYNCIDNYDQVFYVLKFDSLGNKIKEEGCIFSRFMVGERPDSIVFTGRKTKIKIAVATPPGRKTEIKMGRFRDGRSFDLKNLEISNNTAIYETTFKELGAHQMVTIGRMYALDGTITDYDSIVTSVMAIRRPDKKE